MPIKKNLKKAGYKGAVTTIIGRNNRADPFYLKRLLIHENESMLHFKAKLVGAYDWVGLLQKIFWRMRTLNKNKKYGNKKIK